MSFCHLHVHSHYSLLDGLSKIPDLVSHAKRQGFSSLAITDHGSLYGAIEFYQECKEQNIKPIIGAELYIAQRTRHDKQPKLDSKPYHLVVLAENYQGYCNLLKLITRANLEGYYYKPRIDEELLRTYGEGLIALSACLNGEVARSYRHTGATGATTVIEKYQSIFGKDNFFLEVQHNPTLPDQVTLNEGLVELSRATGAPLVATADSHYLEPDDAEAQDILLCIQTKHLLSDDNRMSMRSEDYSLASSAVMEERFTHIPEAITNTERIAERCNVELPMDELHMPLYDIPAGKTADTMLRTLCEAGIAYRYHTESEIQQANQRLDYELAIIAKTGFASYFLIVQDLVNWAKNNGIVVGPGRGSAAGSIVAYLTRITNIDPLRYELLFERFLNPERVSMPDIDLDIADVRRDEVIRYVESKYGKAHVAQIITFGTMAARAAVRDVGRVLGLSYGYCDGISKLIPMFTGLQEAIDQVPELKELYQSDPDATRLLNSALKLEGVVRHTSTHACGIVITEQPLDEYTPLQYSSAGDETIVTQYSLHPVEALGLLKMDFLGLKNLTIIEDTIEIINKTTDTTIAIDDLPLDDKKTYTLLKQGQTTGIFQLESAGMKRYLKQLKPTEFEDIIAMVALYRPGPMERIPDYIAGKHGRRTISYLHQRLEPILEKTYGILVYQEQVMALARDLAGFTAGEGYLLIKAVAKKIKTLLDEQKNKFLDGCVNNGVDPRVAKQIWEFIEPFARYGFNKSHSTGYALIAYQTAYLKANYPAQFMASLLTSDQQDSDRIAIEVQEARDLNIEVVQPDINESYSTFTVVKDSLQDVPRIRFGLAAIKNVGQNLIRAIIDERKAAGVYTDIEDFLSRVKQKDLNKKSLESLIKCGALARLADAATLLHNIERLLQFSKQAQLEYTTGQVNLFGSLPVSNSPKLHLEQAQPITQMQQLQWEKDLLGLYVSAHPLERVMQALPSSVLTIEQALDGKRNVEVQVIGIVNTLRQITTKKGEPMQFIQLEDPSNVVEVVVFPSAMNNIKTMVHEGSIIMVAGKITNRNGETKLIADEITPFASEFIRIALPDGTERAVLTSIQNVLQQYPGDLPVFVQVKGRSIKAETSVSADVLPPLQELLGAEAVLLV